MSASWDQRLKVWDLKTCDILSSFTAEDSFTACAISSTGTAVIAGETSGRLHFLSLTG